jgi:CDGSH-type Zn-finger protein
VVLPTTDSETRDPLKKEYATDETVVQASTKAPLLDAGGVRVLDADGKLLYEGERAALCRCGGSANKPFCDGTHRTNGFSG